MWSAIQPCHLGQTSKKMLAMAISGIFHMWYDSQMAISLHSKLLGSPKFQHCNDVTLQAARPEKKKTGHPCSILRGQGTLCSEVRWARDRSRTPLDATYPLVMTNSSPWLSHGPLIYRWFTELNSMVDLSMASCDK